MKRLRRIAWNGLVALSALLFVATAALWVRSYWRIDSVDWQRLEHRNDPAGDFGGGDDRYFMIDAWDNWGSLTVRWGQGWVQSGLRQHNLDFDSQAAKPLHAVIMFFSYDYDPRTWGGDVIFPIWCLMVLAMILPVVKVVNIVIQRRRQRGRCRVCGYDLRATPERCPECGAVPTGKPYWKT